MNTGQVKVEAKHQEREPMTPLQIAIDGPVGSGKSDISNRLAKELGITYLYTGAMYRAVAWVCDQEKIPFKDASGVVPLLTKYSIDLAPAGTEDVRGFVVKVNGQDVTDELFTPRISQGSSDVSTLPDVRRFMVKRQQELAQGKPVVMEGRDIGLRVLPDAQLKIYLNASLEERARRRWEQRKEENKRKGIEQSLEEVIEDTKKRDEQDMTRDTDPLQKLPDAWELDTTGMTQYQVIEAILSELRRRKLL